MCFGRINRSIFNEINFYLAAILVINSKCIFIIFLVTRIVAQRILKDLDMFDS